jgi:FixJ family two-component response regulator
MSHTRPVVFVVDGDVSVRESLETLIWAAGWQPETFASANEFLARPRSLAPSCLVLDVRLPDMNGLDLQARLVDRTEIAIIFITAHGDVPMTVRAMKAGAVEFLTKPFRDDMLLAAVRQGLERSGSALARDAEMQRLRYCYASLTLRERQVMALVVSGRLNKQAGGELGISETTVKAHRGKVMRKMKARTVPDLVHMAAKLGLAREPIAAAHILSDGADVNGFKIPNRRAVSLRRPDSSRDPGYNTVTVELSDLAVMSVPQSERAA